MDPVVVVGTAYSVAQIVLVLRGLAGIIKDVGHALERTSLEQAISDTAAEFPEIEGLAATIRTWLDDPDIPTAIDSFCARPDDQSAATLTSDLVAQAGFWMGEETRARAHDVVRRFVGYYVRRVLDEMAPVAMHERLSSARHEEDRETQRRMEAKLDVLLGAGERQLDASSLHGHIGELLTKAKELETHHRYGAAKPLYESIATMSTASEPQRFDAMMGAGKCCARLGSNAEAADWYLKASTLRSGDKRAALARVRAALLRKDYGEALQNVRALRESDPTDIDHASLEAEILLAKGDSIDAIAVLLDTTGEPRLPALRDNARAAYLLAHAFFKAQEAEQAHLWAERCRTLEPDSVDHKALAAATAIPLIAAHQLSPNQLDDDGRELAKKSETLLSETIEGLTGTDYRSRRTEAQVNRAAVRVYLGDADGAEKDCLAVLSDSPRLGEAHTNLVRSKMLRGDCDGAVAAYRDGREHGLEPWVLPELVYYLLSQNKALVAAELVTETHGREPGQLEPAALMAATDAFSESGQVDIAAVFLLQLERTLPDDPRVPFTKSHWQRARGELREAEESLRLALSCADGRLRSAMQTQLAAFLSSQGRYDDAIPFYEGVIDTSRDDMLLRDYVRCLYFAEDKAKQIPRCVEVCASVRASLGPLPYYLRYEASVAENLNQLSNARDLYEQLAALTSNDIHALIRLASVEFRLGHIETSHRTLDRVDAATVQDAQALMMMAEGYACCEVYEKALELSYRALRMGFRDPRMHYSFLWLMVIKGAKLKHLLEAPTAVAGTAVTIEMDGETPTYLLTDASVAEPAFHELAVRTGLGATLLGLKSGDTFELDGIVGKTRTLVKEVVSKYVFMLRDVLDNFQTRFVNEKGLVRVRVDTSQAGLDKRIIKMLQDYGGFVDRALGAYNQRRLPIAALARLVGRDVIRARDTVVTAQETAFYCCDGTQSETKEMLGAIGATDTVVLDCTAVLAVIDLQFLDVLTRMFANLLVPQSLDDVVGNILALTPDADEGYLSAPDGHLVYTGPVQGQPYRLRLESLQQMLREKCQRVGRSAPLLAAEVALAEIIGADSLDAILLARDRKVPLFSDDMMLRRLAHTEYNVTGLHSPALIEAAQRRECLSDRALNHALGRLVMLNYVRLPVRGAALAEALTLANFYLDRKLLRALDSLFIAGEALDVVLDVLADFYREMWLMPIPPTTRNGLVQISLQNLLRRVPDPRVVARLLQHVRHKFLLLQDRLPEVEAAVTTYRRLSGLAGSRT